jgi:hypothetical protein
MFLFTIIAQFCYTPSWQFLHEGNKKGGLFTHRSVNPKRFLHYKAFCRRFQACLIYAGKWASGAETETSLASALQ